MFSADTSVPAGPLFLSFTRNSGRPAVSGKCGLSWLRLISLFFLCCLFPVCSSDVRAHPHKLPQLLGERCASFSGTSASASARQLVVSRGRAEAAFPPASFLPVRLWQEKCLLGVPPDACWHVPFLPCVILSLGMSTSLSPLAVSVPNVGTVVPSLQVTARIRLDNCFI